MGFHIKKPNVSGDKDNTREDKLRFFDSHKYFLHILETEVEVSPFASYWIRPWIANWNENTLS